MTLVFGMTVLVIGCDQKGGTVTFINDGYGYSTCTVGIAVSTSGTPNAPTMRELDRDEKISASLDEDGYYAVAGTYRYTPISKSGRLAGGETVTIKTSDFD